eukprot:TRINITY_DN80_c0_g2_i2.p1 TRINITY_DN80_c0_g2~~TRINITY_DN80_c0_g2_i2.p1  ORF type:complete len:120 (-),score=3.05 TRINITY_DN80_c0_g2_i2:65-424(-)
MRRMTEAYNNIPLSADSMKLSFLLRARRADSFVGVGFTNCSAVMIIVRPFELYYDLPPPKYFLPAQYDKIIIPTPAATERMISEGPLNFAKKSPNVKDALCIECSRSGAFVFVLHSFAS